MNEQERRQLVREVELSGNCSHPIRLRGEMVNLATGEVSMSALRVACKDRRHVVCPSCSYLYRADAWILVASGLNGGKGTSELVSTHPRLFVTLTAPSFGAVHTITTRGGCVERSRVHAGVPEKCIHARARFCADRHTCDDARLGQPLCDDCFDVEGAVLWNAHASRLWNNTVQAVRRSVADAGTVTQVGLSRVARVHYFKVAEVQRRGLIHFHSLVRADGPNGPDSEPPEWLTSELLRDCVERSLPRVTAHGLDGRTLRWGRVHDVRDLSNDSDDVTKVASYLAKYATKTSDGTKDLAHRFRSRRQIESLVDDPHYRRLALAAWDLGERPTWTSLHLRDHAHAFGFTGQLITKSRGYSTTFGALRAARAQYMKSQNTGEPVAGTFYYDGRGYDDPRGSELAEMFFAMQQELREEAFRAKRSSSDAS